MDFDILKPYAENYYVSIISINPEPARHNIGIITVVRAGLSFAEARMVADQLTSRITSPMIEVKIRPMGKFHEIDDSTPDRTLQIGSSIPDEVITRRLQEESVVDSPAYIASLVYRLFCSKRDSGLLVSELRDIFSRNSTLQDSWKISCQEYLSATGESHLFEPMIATFDEYFR